MIAKDNKLWSVYCERCNITLEEGFESAREASDFELNHTDYGLCEPCALEEDEYESWG